MPKLCPFRKITYFMDILKNGKEYNVRMGSSMYTVEDFQHCYEAECAVYDRATQRCGLDNQAWRL